MKQIKKQIMEYLSNENIPVVYFHCADEINFIENYYTQLAIKIKKKDFHKWMYFYFMANNDLNHPLFSLECKKGIINDTLIFNFMNVASHEEIETLKYSLYMFLKTLQKKYYTVCPTRQRRDVIIKTSLRCNLDCKYCYDKPYREKINCDMSLEVLDRILYVMSQSIREGKLIFHGGEPTLVGTEWFEQAFNEIIPKYPMLKTNFSMVSNGTLLDDEWFNLFKKYSMGCAISYNAKYQTDLRCSSQTNKNEQKDEELNKKVEQVIKGHHERTSVIDIINKLNYKDMIEIYEYYKSIGKNTVIMQPAYETKQTEKNELEMTPEDYSSKFLEFFKYWLYDNTGINVRVCSHAISRVIGDKNIGNCDPKDCRNICIGINPIGEVYPCNRYFPERYKFCNIFDIESFDDIYETEGYKLYSKEIEERYNNICRKCNYFEFCYGLCNSSVIEQSGDATGIDEFGCELLQYELNGVYDILRDIDSANYNNVNKNAEMIMRTYGFISVKEIKKLLADTGMNIPLEYDKHNLFECSEFKIFRFINHERSKENNEIKNIRRNLKNLKKNGKNQYGELCRYFKHLIKLYLVSELNYND